MENEKVAAEKKRKKRQVEICVREWYNRRRFLEIRRESTEVLCGRFI